MKIRLTSVFAALLLAVSGLPAKAQKIMPLCETSTGQPGRLFNNMFGYVAVPRSFDKAETGDEKVRLLPSGMTQTEESDLGFLSDCICANLRHARGNFHHCFSFGPSKA